MMSTHFVAIINPPEAGILAVGSAMQVPVVEDGAGESWHAHESHHLDRSPGDRMALKRRALCKPWLLYLEEPMRLVL